MKNSGRVFSIATIIIFYSHSLFAQTNAEKLQQLLTDAYAAIEMHQPLDKKAWCNKVRPLIIDELDPVDLHMVGPGDFNVMHYAAGFGDVALIDILHEQDPTLLLGNTLGVTPLHVAAGEDQVSAVFKLTNLGANCNARGIHGATPLHVAAYCNHVQAMIVLLMAGANLEATTTKGHTPLHSATLNLRLAAMATLLRQGANPNALTVLRNSPLNLTKQTRQLSATVLLIAHGAVLPVDFIVMHVNLRSCVADDGFRSLTAVHDRFEMLATCAFTMHDLTFAQAVLMAQALPGETYLHAAVRLGRDDLLQLVLQRSSQEALTNLIDQLNANGMPAVGLALQNGQYGLADLLRDAGASLLMGNLSGLTLTYTLPPMGWLNQLREQGIAEIWHRGRLLMQVLCVDVVKHVCFLIWRTLVPANWVTRRKK